MVVYVEFGGYRKLNSTGFVVKVVCFCFFLLSVTLFLQFTAFRLDVNTFQTYHFTQMSLKSMIRNTAFFLNIQFSMLDYLV